MPWADPYAVRSASVVSGVAAGSMRWPAFQWLYLPFGCGDGAGGDAEQAGQDGPGYCQALPHDGDQGFLGEGHGLGWPPARRRVAGPPRAMCIWLRARLGRGGPAR